MYWCLYSAARRRIRSQSGPNPRTSSTTATTSKHGHGSASPSLPRGMPSQHCSPPDDCSRCQPPAGGKRQWMFHVGGVQEAAPPTFIETAEPQDADDWVRTIEDLL